jgi:hypothetical protein
MNGSRDMYTSVYKYNEFKDQKHWLNLHQHYRLYKSEVMKGLELKNY